MSMALILFVFSPSTSRLLSHKGLSALAYSSQHLSSPPLVVPSLMKKIRISSKLIDFLRPTNKNLNFFGKIKFFKNILAGYLNDIRRWKVYSYTMLNTFSKILYCFTPLCLPISLANFIILQLMKRVLFGLWFQKKFNYIAQST